LTAFCGVLVFLVLGCFFGLDLEWIVGRIKNHQETSKIVKKSQEQFINLPIVLDRGFLFARFRPEIIFKPSKTIMQIQNGVSTVLKSS
jgi:hypothetical protein